MKKRNRFALVILAVIMIFACKKLGPYTSSDSTELIDILPASRSSEIIFSSDIEHGTLDDIFQEEVNRYGGVICEISANYAHSGSRSIKIGYPKNEAGVNLKPLPFLPTKTLFIRKYEYYALGWEQNWPIGLKTCRYFTRPDFSTGNPGDKWAYMSEKLIWQTNDATCDELYGMGMNNAIGDLDLIDFYEEDELFGNGLPYIRTNHWYKFETWMVLDSDVDANDGILMIWIDDVLVYENNAVPWRSTERERPNGEGWQSMWFGGNYTGGSCGGPSDTVYRYIDDVYLSTTLDRRTIPQFDDMR